MDTNKIRERSKRMFILNIIGSGCLVLNYFIASKEIFKVDSVIVLALYVLLLSKLLHDTTIQHTLLIDIIDKLIKPVERKKMLRKTRIRWASKFGRIEHKFGRLQFIPTITGTIIYAILKPELITGLLFSLTLFFQTIYLFSHSIEKKIYGRAGLR